MKLVSHNTADHRAIYSGMNNRWLETVGDKTVFEELIEPAVREFCKAIADTGLAVPLYSCEGHCEEDPEQIGVSSGYVMMIAKNREGEARMLQMLRGVSFKCIQKWGWNFTPEIESDLATTGDEHDIVYSCLVIRAPQTENPNKRNKWWATATAALKAYAS